MAVQPSNLGNKVNVVIRARPLIDREKNENATNNWYMDSNIIQQYQPGTMLLSTSPPYAFDYIFGQQAKTDEVYQKVVAPIVEKSLQGFNGTVLCYGQTSSGKTFTMYGNDDEPGIIFLTAQDLFRRFEEGTRSYFVRIGLLEVYNEKLTDLLDDKKKAIDIKEVKGEVFPKDLREIDCYSPEDMLEAARRVQQERRKGETLMNKESSRSHTILRILIQSVANEETEDTDAPQVTNALLNFVDLAGSEKAEQTGAVGERLKEAGYINKSLFTLSQVVNQLSSQIANPNLLAHTSNGHNNSGLATNGTLTAPQSAKQISKTQPFVSYRDSKLTRILQSSLSGNAYIALICNVTPASVEETHSTLRFANRAKCIKVDPTKNLGPATASEYKSKILDLEKQLNGKSSELDRLRKQLAAMQKFVKPLQCQNSPATFHPQPDRRRTMCPSMLFAHRSAALFSSAVATASSSAEDPFQADGLFFKIPKSPNRRSLMPTTASNRSHQLDRSFEINPNFQLSMEDSSTEPPPAKIAKVDAQTSTEFPTLPALALQARLSPLRKLKPTVRLELNQSTIEEITSEKSFINHEKSIELEELSSKCEELEAELQEVRANKERLESENDILQKNLSDTKSRNQTIMSDYERLQEENISKTEFLSEIQDELGELRTKLQESEEALVAAKAKAAEESEREDWQSKYEALLSQMNVLREENDGVKGALRETKMKLTEAEDKLEAKSTENTESVKKYDVVIVRNQELEIELESVRADKDRAQSELVKSAASLDDLQKEKEALSADMAQLRQEKQNQRGEFLKLELEKEEVTIKYDKILQMLAQIESELEFMKKINHSLEEQATGFKEQLKAGEQGTESLLQEVQAKQQLIESLEDKLRASQEQSDSLQEQIKAGEELAESIQVELKTSQEYAGLLSSQLKQTEDHTEALKNQLKEAQIAAESLQNQLQANEELIDSLQTQIQCNNDMSNEVKSELEAARVDLEAAKANKEAVVEELTFRIDALTKANEDLSCETHKLQADHEDLSSKFEALSIQLLTAEADKEELVNEIEIATEKAAELELQLTSSQEENTALKAELDKVRVQTEAETDCAVQELRKQLEELMSTLACTQKDYQTATAQADQAREEMGIMSEKLQSLSTTLDQTEATLMDNVKLKEELEAELSSLKPELVDIKEQLRHSEERERMLTAQLEQATSSYEETQKALEDIKAENQACLEQQSIQYQEQLDFIKLSMETKAGELQARNLELFNEIEALKAQSETRLEGTKGSMGQLEQQMQELHRKREELESDLMNQQETQSRLKEELDASTCECERLRLENQNLTQELENTCDKLATVQLEYTSLKSELEATVIMQDSLQHQVHELEHELTATKDAVPQIDELRQNNAKLLMDIEELQRESAEREATEISALKSKLEEAQKTSQGLQDMVESLKNAQSASATNAQELDEAMKAKEDLENQLEELNAQLEAIKSTLSDSQTTASNLRAQVDELSITVASLQSENASMKIELGTSENSREELKQQVSTLQHDYQVLKEASDGQVMLLKEENLTITNQLGSLQSSHDYLHSKCSTVETERDEVFSNFQVLSTKFATLESDYESTNAELTSARQLTQQLQNQIQSLEEQLLETKGCAADQDKIEELQKQQAELLEQSEILKELCETLKAELELTKSEARETEDALRKEFESKWLRSQEDTAAVQAEKEEIMKQLEEASQKVVTMELQLRATAKSRESLLGQVETLQADLRQYVEQLSSYEQLKRQNTQLADEVESLQTELATVEGQLAKIREEAEEAITVQVGAIRAEADEAKAQLASVLEQAESTKVALESAQSAVATSTQKHDALLAQRDTLKAESQAHMEESERLKVENEQVQLKYETAFSMLSQVEAELERVQKLKDKLQAQLDCGSQSTAQELSVLRTERDELQSQISTLQAELEALQVSQESLHKENQRVSTELNNVQGQLKAARTSRQSIETELQACQKALEEVKTSFYKEKSNSQALKTANEDLTQRCAKLSASCDSLQKAHSALQSTLDQANQANVTLQEKIKALEIQAGEATVARPRPKLRSTASQIEPPYDVDERIRRYKQIAERGDYLRRQAEKELEKLQKELKIVQQQVAKLEADKAELLTSVVQYAEEADRLKAQIKIPPPTAETETQCTLMDEIFKDSKIKKVGPLPRGWPDLHNMYKESVELRGKVAVLELAKDKCTCSTSASARPASVLPYQQIRIPEGLYNRTRSASTAPPAAPRLGILTSRPEPPNADQVSVSSASSSSMQRPVVSRLAQKFEPTVASTTTNSGNPQSVRIPTSTNPSVNPSQGVANNFYRPPPPSSGIHISNNPRPRPDLVSLPTERVDTQPQQQRPRRNLFDQPVLSMEDFVKRL